MISILASGKESLKFLNGFRQIISPKDVDLNVIVDTFDFFDFYDIRIYPQLTNVVLLFMNQLNENKWTGKINDTHEISTFLQDVDEKFPSVKELYEVGDLYLAPNIFIDFHRKNSHPLSECITEFTEKITEAAIIPLSNDELKQELNSKELSNAEGVNEPKNSKNTLFDEFESIMLSNEAKEAILESELIIIPKPPIVSILAFLKISKFQEVLKDAVGQIIFISPIKEKELDSTSLLAFQEARLPPSSIGLTKALRGLVDIYVIDTIEAPLKNRITRYGTKVFSYPLNLDTAKTQLEVAEFVLKLTPLKDIVESLEYKAKKEVASLKQGLRKLVGGLKRIKSRPTSSKEDYKEEDTEKEKEDAVDNES